MGRNAGSSSFDQAGTGGKQPGISDTDGTNTRRQIQVIQGVPVSGNFLMGKSFRLGSETYVPGYYSVQAGRFQ